MKFFFGFFAIQLIKIEFVKLFRLALVIKHSAITYPRKPPLF